VSFEKHHSTEPSKDESNDGRKLGNEYLKFIRELPKQPKDSQNTRSDSQHIPRPKPDYLKEMRR